MNNTSMQHVYITLVNSLQQKKKHFFKVKSEDKWHQKELIKEFKEQHI